MIRFLATIILVFAVPAAARAQQAVQPEAPAQGTEIPIGLALADLRIGPVYLQPRIGVQDFGWDTNPFGFAPDQIQEGDFRATLSPGTKLAIPIRQRHIISGDIQLDYVWYKDNDALRSVNTLAAARYQYSSNRWQVDVSDQFFNGRRSQYDLVEIGDSLIPPQPEIVGRVKELTNTLSGTARWDVSRRIFLLGAASRRILRFDQSQEVDGISIADEADRTEEGVRGELGYRFTTRTSIALSVDWTRADYENPKNFRSYETYRAGAAVALTGNSAVSGNLLVGYRDTAPKFEFVEAFDGIVADGTVTIEPGVPAQVTISGTRDIFPSFWFTNIYALRVGGGMSLLFQANRSLRLGIEGSVFEHRYPTEATSTQVDGSSITAKRLDHLLRYNGIVRWQTGLNSTLSVRIGYFKRTSNFNRLNRDGLFVGTGVSVVY